MSAIDYTEAFKSMNHEAIWETLHIQEIPKSNINIIWKTYACCKVRIQMESIGETFKIERYVRQGDGSTVSQANFGAAQKQSKN